MGAVPRLEGMVPAGSGPYERSISEEKGLIRDS